MPAFKYPRTSQPQGAVELSNSPLAKGILIALPLGGSRLNSVGSDRRLASAVGAGSGVSAKGVAAKFGGSDYISLGTAPLIASNKPCAFSIYEESFATSAFTALLGLTASGSANQFIFLRGTTEAPVPYTCAVGPTNSGTLLAKNFAGIGPQVAGEKIRFFVTCSNGLGSNTGIRVWANGTELTTVGGSTFGAGAAGTSYLGWDGFDYKFNGLLSDFVFWGRVPSDAEVKSYFDTPAQIYAATPRSLWIPGTVSGGSSHTLTGANSTQSSTSGTGGITQAHLLTGASCSQSATSGTGAIAQTHLLTGAGSSQTAVSGTGAIIAGAVHILAAANASQSATSSSAAITQGHVLISAPSVQDSTASASAIVQRHMLAAVGCSQAAVSGVGAITSTAPGAAVYPLASQVLAGVQYGPTGADYVGTLTGGSGPSAAEIASAVIAAAQVTPIWADARRMNGAVVQGDGSEANLWRGASV